MTLLQKLNRVPRALRLLSALIPALLLFGVLRGQHYAAAAAFLPAWSLFAGVVLAFSWLTILSNNPRDAALVAREQDISRLLSFLFIVGAAFISLFAILALLQNLPTFSKRGLTMHIWLAVIAVTSSWLLIQTLFTLRYAHLYYRPDTCVTQHSGGSGLRFPDGRHPDLLDFAYFSFVLGMTYQVSDVTITSRRIRHLVLVHSLLAFVFNTVIVAFTINIVYGIISR
ncbi:MAG: DUF1345 domain-containing protein [Chitinophagaceae bacterium]|nr:MAG: DUF1345 domain-containing protein [Chitinophagaceae bacterium]